MKRAIRRAKQAQIRLRLYREYGRREARRVGYAWNTVTPEENLREIRHLLRNEGKPFRRCYECGDRYCRCEWCIANKSCRARREQERLYQEQQEWFSGIDTAHPITEGELSQVRKAGRRQKSELQLRRDKRHCPVCLASLPKNALTNNPCWTKYTAHCSACYAMPSASHSCPRCGAASVWHNRLASACRNCGWHDSRLHAGV